MPLPQDINWSKTLYQYLNKKLIDEHKTYSAWFKHNGKWWTRVSVQVFNEVRYLLGLPGGKNELLKC